jgi:hypothetical protein
LVPWHLLLLPALLLLLVRGLQVLASCMCTCGTSCYCCCCGRWDTACSAAGHSYCELGLTCHTQGHLLLLVLLVLLVLVLLVLLRV